MNAIELLAKLHEGDRRALSRCISLIENDAPEASYILENLNINHHCKVIGITGPPGAGKSTLVNALLEHYTGTGHYPAIAVLAIDPTSPFTHGSLLGDRLRMNEHFENPDIFIRSLATRGALGGLSAKTIEISDLLKAAGFNCIIIETVGVGQSELEIAALADTTIVVFVPESGDEIQTIKSGIMEIADIFAVNKADREGAGRLVKNLLTTLHDRPSSGWNVPVVQTIASTRSGIDELAKLIGDHLAQAAKNVHNKQLTYSRALRLVQNQLLKKIDLNKFRSDLESQIDTPGFNIYRFISAWLP
ncbi:MAG: methylmalonyl Co-A mutase-associated GTPase MeaB [Bacteroidota bacterium]|nr:methylmalonyl Co-A mutase-associated GTPase MeaB [Bacteroidota bacterium]